MKRCASVACSLSQIQKAPLFGYMDYGLPLFMVAVVRSVVHLVLAIPSSERSKLEFVHGLDIHNPSSHVWKVRSVFVYLFSFSKPIQNQLIFKCFNHPVP